MQNFSRNQHNLKSSAAPLYFCLIFLGWLIALANFWPQPVNACATCLCGDPTLVTLGNEKPFAQRLRVTYSAIFREESIGQPQVNHREIAEQQHIASLAYWPSDYLGLVVNIPYVHRQFRDANGALEEGNGLGDLEVDGRLYAWRSNNQQHWAGLLIGARLPTAPEHKLDDIALDNDAQPGAGLWLPKIGVWYAYFNYPWTLNTHLTLRWSTNTGYNQYQLGTTATAGANVQYAFNYALAWQLGLEARHAEADTYTGQLDPNSGGSLTYLSSALLYSTATDVVLSLKIQAPMINNLHGAHQERAVFATGVSYDF